MNVAFINPFIESTLRSLEMMASIAAFVKNGNPNNAALGDRWDNWPATLVFDASAVQARIFSK